MDPVKLLQGDEWLGHPAHPAVISGPIGMWTFSFIMDIIAAVTKKECAQEAADYALTGGLITAGLAVPTGIGEYLRVPRGGQAKSEATIHGALNATAVGLYAINGMIRSGRKAEGRPGGFLPKLLSLAGIAIIGYTGWLGGKMSYEHGIGVKCESALEEQKKLQQEQCELECKRVEPPQSEVGGVGAGV